MRGRRAWLRDATVWLALGLSIATTMVVLSRTNASTPRATTALTTSHTVRDSSGASKPRTTPHALVPGHLQTPTPKRSRSAVANDATTTTLVERPGLRTATTLARPNGPSGASNSPSIPPAIAVVTEQWAGTLAYPDDVATSYTFKTAGGTVVVRTSLLRGAAGLSSSLQCSDSSLLSTSHTAETTMKAQPGTCTYNLQFNETAFASGARAVYRIIAQYPAVVPAS